MREAWLLTDGRHEPANAQSNRAGHMTVFPFERFDDADSIQEDSLSRSSLSFSSPSLEHGGFRQGCRVHVRT